MGDDELLMNRKIKAELRRRQREQQQQQQPIKYEQVKITNRNSTAKYDEKKRLQRKLLTKNEIVADKRLKAEARRHQRVKKKLKSMGFC